VFCYLLLNLLLLHLDPAIFITNRLWQTNRPKKWI